MSVQKGMTLCCTADCCYHVSRASCLFATPSLCLSRWMSSWILENWLEFPPRLDYLGWTWLQGFFCRMFKTEVAVVIRAVQYRNVLTRCQCVCMQLLVVWALPKHLNRKLLSQLYLKQAKKRFQKKKPNTYPVSAADTSLKHYHRELAKMKLSLIIINLKQPAMTEVVHWNWRNHQTSNITVDDYFFHSSSWFKWKAALPVSTSS